MCLYVPSCDVRYDFRIKRCSVRLYLQLFVGGFMSYFCVFVVAYSGVQHILGCVFVFFVMSTLDMLPVSLDCPLLISPPVFSNIYFLIHSVSKRISGTVIMYDIWIYQSLYTAIKDVSSIRDRSTSVV